MKNIVRTPDIYFAAAMLALGASIEEVDKTDRKHMRFLLVRHGYEFKSNILKEALQASNMMDFEYYEKEWANKTLLINAIDFKDAIQRMKSIIHAD